MNDKICALLFVKIKHIIVKKTFERHFNKNHWSNF